MKFMFKAVIASLAKFFQCQFPQKKLICSYMYVLNSHLVFILFYPSMGSNIFLVHLLRNGSGFGATMQLSHNPGISDGCDMTD